MYWTRRDLRPLVNSEKEKREGGTPQAQPLAPTPVRLVKEVFASSTHLGPPFLLDNRALLCFRRGRMRRLEGNPLQPWCFILICRSALIVQATRGTPARIPPKMEEGL
jgi:hypothetical protein